MKKEIKHQLKLALSTIFHQIFGYRKTSLQQHIDRERFKQLQPYKGYRTFNLFIWIRDQGYCYLCGHFKCYAGGKPMVTEHKIPLVRGGYTTEQNCALACWHCNDWKGTRIL